jgi:hypothetical protein
MADIVYTNADTARRRAEDPEIQQTLNAAYERYTAGAQDGTIFTDQYGKVTNFAAPADTATTERKTASAPSTQATTPTAGSNATSEGVFNKASAGGYLPATEKNILHNYRSWTYNFALGALTPQALANNKLLASDIKKYAVLNSAGKGSAGMGVSSTGGNAKLADYQETNALVNGFNANSPGRFDMFIDNVELDSTVGNGTPEDGPTTATALRFDVFEPYSMNGFVEALQAAAKAAGYSDYIQATFGLRVQFQGWPDTSTNAQSTPEIIPMSVRYFCITLTKVEVDVSENGTKYKICAVPAPQMALGEPNTLTSDIKIDGETVGDVLKNFFVAINKMVGDRVKNETDVPGRDTYEISAPKLSTVGSPQNVKAAILNGSTSSSYTSEIIKSKMADELSSVQVYKFADPANYPGGVVPGSTSTNTTTNPSTGKLTPKSGNVVFAAGTPIHECIAAIVRDSHYTRDLLKPENLDKVKKGNGLITYFSIRMETEILREDTVNQKRFQNYRYVLEPYQMHYSRVPGQQLGNIDLKDIKGKIKREYNYIYTGKNEDVTKFHLNFNNLYFAAIPAMMGNRTETNPHTQSAAPNKEVTVKNEASTASTDQKSKPPNSVSTAPVKPDSKTAQDFKAGAVGTQPQGDPYSRLAKVFHDAALDNVNLITGDLDIFGDPYFLTTGGMNNGDLVLKDPMMTLDGQAPTTQGDLYISINFKNPIDINSKTGLMDFGTQPVSFSGIYRVTQLKNTFKDGIFAQSLKIVRMEGQILGKESEKLPLSGKTAPLPGQQVIKDTIAANILKLGIRPSDFDLGKLLSRGLPSPGLPGSISNFVNAASSTVGGVLNQVAGATSAVSQITNQLGVSPIGGVNALTSGVRLAASGLSSLTTLPQTAAASIAAAGASIGNIAGIVDAPAKLAANVATQAATLGNVASGAITQGTALVQSVSTLATTAYKNVSGLVGDVNSKITALQNTIPTDFSSAAAKMGVDPSVFAGLSPDLASKLGDQLTAAAKLVPSNTNLKDLNDQGVSFSSITGDKLPNLPAIQPKAIVQAALADPELAAIAARAGNVEALLSGKANLPDLTNINNVTNALGKVSSGFGSINAAVGSVQAANAYVNNTIATAAGLANSVGSLGQNASLALSPANLGLGSVESNIQTVANLTQNVSRTYNQINLSASNLYGSLQSSPLTKLVKDNNIEGSV